MVTGLLTCWRGELSRKFSRFGGGPRHGGLLEEGKILNLLSLVMHFGDRVQPSMALSSSSPFLHLPSGWDEGASFCFLKPSLLLVAQAAVLASASFLGLQGKY